MRYNPGFSPIEIHLACGCIIKKRDTPRSEKQKFTCTSGAGHGYQGHSWIKCVEPEGKVTVNRSLNGGNPDVVK